jgi:hypothetical protein
MPDLTQDPTAATRDEPRYDRRTENGSGPRRRDRRLKPPSVLCAALGYTPETDFAAARRALIARIDAVEACLDQRKPRPVQDEIKALLCGARDILDLSEPGTEPNRERLRAAAVQYRQAQRVYYGYILKANRYLYLAGVLASVVALIVVAFALYGSARFLASNTAPPASHIFASADLVALLILLGFAGLGTMVSVVTRLERLPMPDTFTWPFVVIAGAGRPVVAAVFASVIYAILRGEVINIRELGRPILDATGPYWWCVLVAFLCGYSERFAPDLLARSPFGGNDETAVPPQRAPAPVARPTDTPSRAGS